MFDDPLLSPVVARAYCPGCEPRADPFLEMLDVHWCEKHPLEQAGVDDALATGSAPDGSLEAGGEPNQRWCELIHREAKRRK